MASGHVLWHIQRPDTWQLRPALCVVVDKTLAKPEPSTHGAIRPRPQSAPNRSLQDCRRMSEMGWFLPDRF